MDDESKTDLFEINKNKNSNESEIKINNFFKSCDIDQTDDNSLFTKTPCKLLNQYNGPFVEKCKDISNAQSINYAKLGTIMTHEKDLFNDYNKKNSEKTSDKDLDKNIMEENLENSCNISNKHKDSDKNIMEENLENSCNISNKQILNLFFKLEMLNFLESQLKGNVVEKNTKCITKIFDVMQFKSIYSMMLKDMSYKQLKSDTGRIRQQDQVSKQGFIVSDTTNKDVHFHEKIFLYNNLDIDCIRLNNITIKFDVFCKENEMATSFNPCLDLDKNTNFTKYGYISQINKTKKQGYIKECTFDVQSNTYQFHYDSFYCAILEPEIIQNNNIKLKFQCHQSQHSRHQKTTSIICTDELGNDISMLVRKKTLEFQINNQNYEQIFCSKQDIFKNLYNNNKNNEMARLLN